ncbi:hypothetical protein BKI49_28815 [Streptomyces sp. Tue6028]|uniref:DUF3592 domain-containing protein n=1 Tax=Streptomyces sp. Tue6028 TaxID=2036037 RepID=UPI000BB359A6|nr:DUF3592 domain-containing protein [Streptomyces sp. Tue6028]PBC60512.1 hypothetical protein BKI49_28815 [Streptomyces sp. Tue6028]
MHLTHIRATLSAVRKWVPLVLGLSFLALTAFTVYSATVQWQRGRLIDDTGVQVTGTVTRLLHVDKGYKKEIAYTVDGRRHTLNKGYDPTLHAPRRGDRVCLEAAREHPDIVRMCEDHYPQGDDTFPAYILGAFFCTAGLLFVIGHQVTVARRTREIGTAA